MTIRNLTPHEVTVLDDQDRVIARYPSEGVARAEEESSPAFTVDGVPVVWLCYGLPVGLPDPEEGTWLIVSTITYQATVLGERPMRDLLTVTDLVRDADGRVIGCRALAQSTPLPRNRWLGG